MLLNPRVLNYPLRPRGQRSRIGFSQNGPDPLAGYLDPLLTLMSSIGAYSLTPYTGPCYSGNPLYRMPSFSKVTSTQNPLAIPDSYYSPYAKVFVKRSVRHLCDAMLSYNTNLLITQLE